MAAVTDQIFYYKSEEEINILKVTADFNPLLLLM